MLAVRAEQQETSGKDQPLQAVKHELIHLAVQRLESVLQEHDALGLPLSLLAMRTERAMTEAELCNLRTKIRCIDYCLRWCSHTAIIILYGQNLHGAACARFRLQKHLAYMDDAHVAVEQHVKGDPAISLVRRILRHLEPS